MATIGKQGRAGFYEGRVADALVDEMASGGGLITHQFGGLYAGMACAGALPIAGMRLSPCRRFWRCCAGAAFARGGGL